MNILAGMVGILGILCITLSALFLVLNHHSVALGLFLFSNFLVVFSIDLLLRRTYKRVPAYFNGFLFLFCTALPVIGAIIAWFIAWVLKRTLSATHKDPEILEPTINLQEIVPFEARYGAGGVVMQLLNKDLSIASRTKALFMLNKIQLGKINQLIYKLLPEQSDEMRLLAFNILEGQEDAISKKINKLLEKLKNKELSTESRGKLEKDLAEQYWELIYNHLISQELEETILEKALSHGKNASKCLKEDPAVWILLGKIHKYKKQYDKAEQAFNKAKTLHIPPMHVLPYLAELKYLSQDYKGMLKYLRESDTLLDIPEVAPVKQFWESK